MRLFLLVDSFDIIKNQLPFLLGIKSIQTIAGITRKALVMKIAVHRLVYDTNL